MTPIRTLLCTAGVLLFAQAAQAQVPFFPGGATAFTPEISIINTGALNDVQAVVSADRKYVTLNMRPQNATLLALRQFTFQNAGPGMGNVGGVGAGAANGNAAQIGRNGGAESPSAAVRTSPSDILDHAKAQASILFQSGMIRVSKLNQ